MSEPHGDLSRTRQRWQVVIFIVDGKANHAGLVIPQEGLADLSLLGARIVPWGGPQMPKGVREFFELPVAAAAPGLEFLRRPGLLTAPIIRQEKAARGWHLTCDAPDFVRTLRTTRSRDPDDMNCVEWIVHAIELTGREMPPNVMTPAELHGWCSANLAKTTS